MPEDRWMRRLATKASELAAQLRATFSLGDRHLRRRHRLVGPAHMWEMKRDFQIDFLRRHGLQPEHRLVDIGCGTLRGGIPLIRYLDDGHYCGIEAREEAIIEGRVELEETGLTTKEPQLICSSDFASLNLAERFDFAWAFSVLFHMPDAVLGQAFTFVGHHLKPGASFYANVKIGTQKTGSWKGFPVVWRPMAMYLALAARNGMTVEDIGSLADVGHVAGKASHDEQRMLRFQKT